MGKKSSSPASGGVVMSVLNTVGGNKDSDQLFSQILTCNTKRQGSSRLEGGMTSGSDVTSYLTVDSRIREKS